MNASEQALQDWGSRIGVEALARIRAHNPANYEHIERESPEALELAANAALTGAALALECFQRIGVVDMPTIQRLVEATP